MTSNALLNRFIRFAALFICGAGISLSAMAANGDGAMARSSYVVVTGDINGDGQNDILFIAARPKIVMIPFDDDLMLPISVPSPSPSFALISNSYGHYTLVLNPGTDITSAAIWKSATQRIVYSGPTGAYLDSATITATSNEQASFVVAMLADGSLQITGITAPAVDTTAPVPVTPTPGTPAPAGSTPMTAPPSIAPNAVPLPPGSCDV